MHDQGDYLLALAIIRFWFFLYVMQETFWFFMPQLFDKLEKWILFVSAIFLAFVLFAWSAERIWIEYLHTFPPFTMKRFIALGALTIALAACGITPYKTPAPTPIEPPSSEPMVFDEPSSVGEMKEIVIVDQSYDVRGKKGTDWLRAIGTVHISGNIESGELIVDLSRGEKLTGWSGIGMYIAEEATSKNWNAYPDETRFGTHLYFLNAFWKGNCKRNLDVDSSFGVIKEHSNHLEMDLQAVTMTKGDDGCDKGQDVVNLVDLINDGVFLGFAPSADGYNAKVVLRYRGDLEVKKF